MAEVDLKVLVKDDDVESFALSAVSHGVFQGSRKSEQDKLYYRHQCYLKNLTTCHCNDCHVNLRGKVSPIIDFIKSMQPLFKSYHFILIFLP